MREAESENRRREWLEIIERQNVKEQGTKKKMRRKIKEKKNRNRKAAIERKRNWVKKKGKREIYKEHGKIERGNGEIEIGR